MKQQVKITTGIQILAVWIGILGILLLGPMHLFSEKTATCVDTSQCEETRGLKRLDESIMQQFLPTYQHVDTIEVMIDSLGVAEGNFRFRLYDQNLTVLWEDIGMFSQHPGVDYHVFPVNLDVTVGQPYYYTLDSIGTSFSLVTKPKTDERESGLLFLNQEEIPGMIAVANYRYTTPFSLKKTVACCVFLGLLSVVVVGITALLEKRRKYKRRILVKNVIVLGVNAVVAAAAVYIAERIMVDHIFSNIVQDNIVLTLGVILTAMAVIYGVAHTHISFLFSYEKKELWEKIRMALQVIFWAFALMACCDFVNAGSNYAQGLALREMCTYFALACITTFTKKEFFNLWNGIYVIVAVIACVLYVKPFLGQGEPYETAVRTAVMFAFAGIIILSTIYNLVHKKVADFSLPYAGLVAVFFLLLLLFRNGIIWEVAVVVPFGLFYIRSFTQKERNQILGNIANGVILSFFIWLYQSLRYRPFHYFVLVRYEGMFMTVTVASVYLALVLTVAICKLWTAYEKDPTLKGTWKELCVLGLAAGFEFLTLSRTGIITSVAVYVTALFLYVLFHREKTKELLFSMAKYVVYTALAVLFFIPVAYTAARTIPAVVNQPYIYLGEEFEDSIKVGEPWNSYRYITVSKFLGLSSERILGKTDFNHMTASGKTVEEVLKEARENQSEETKALLEQSGIQVTDNQVLYTDEYGSEYAIDAPDYSNGRTAIFKEYLSRLNLTGHAAVAITREDGSIFAAHAHNTFIQMAYDCGIITGIVFVIVYVVLGFRSVWYYRKRKEKDSYAMLPVLIFATFGVAGMVEYVFRPTVPLGFVFLLMISPLLVKQDKKERKQDKELEQKSS